VSQFERLAERGIDVYWAGGRADPPASWPSFAPLPSNVHVFPSERVEQFVHQRDGAPVARILGASRPLGRTVHAKDFSPDPAGLPSIAVIHGKASPEALRSRGIDYWALGGNHARSTPFSSPQTAHWPGSPQGRRPSEPGPHGCSLVQVDAERHVRITLIPCDVLRWHREQMVLDEAAGPKDLERRLHDRVRALREAAPGIDLMVSWTIAAGGRLAARLRRGSLGVELLQTLRGQYGMTQPAAWSVSLSAESGPMLPAQWYEQDTIRGDFLREIRRLQQLPVGGCQLSVALGEFPPAIERQLTTKDRHLTTEDRQLLLREAAALGADLLSGEEPLS